MKITETVKDKIAFSESDTSDTSDSDDVNTPLCTLQYNAFFVYPKASNDARTVLKTL